MIRTLDDYGFKVPFINIQKVKNMSEDKIKNSPEKKFRCGGVAATIWKNNAKKDGKDIEFFSVNIERSYKDKDGNWQKTNSFGVNDLHKVSVVAEKAFSFLLLIEE